MTRYHRTDEDGTFERLSTKIPAFEYTVTNQRVTDHFHTERHDDKYLPDGRADHHTMRLAADGGIQYPKRVAVDGQQVEFTYEDLLGERTETGEIFEFVYDADAGHITRICVRVHYSHAPSMNVEGYDVTHVIDLTGGAPTHVTCWLNRKSDDDDSHNGNTGE